jgi:hypothetical protein
MIAPIPWPLPHASLLSDAHLDALRTESKKKSSSSREKEKMGHIERQFEVVSSSNPERNYRIFIRRSVSNEDVFSVGLTLILPERDLVLCRYNSAHHGHRNILEKVKIPPSFHQHITTQRYIAADLDRDGFAILRTDYNSIDTALALLVNECNIEGIFKPDPQAKLFPS